MIYREIRPHALLARFVECFWTLEGEARTESPTRERILPDGCVELILNFGARFQEHKDNGERENQPMNLLVGQMTRPIFIAPTGSVKLLGIRFHPGGTFPFFRIPLHEVTNSVSDLGGVAGEFERELLACSDSDADTMAAVQKFLLERMSYCKHDSWVVDLAAKMVGLGGQVSIDALASEAGVSGRQLERRFLPEVGIGPKLLCRILRFQQIFRAQNGEHDNWAALAARCGYYDQAHLIRDFKQFARETPASLLRQSSVFTESFTRKHRRSDFSNTHA